MPYIFAELQKVKGEGQYPEYEDVLKAVQDAAYARAGDIWEGYEPGGLTPGPKQFGVGPLRKNDMAGNTTDSTPSGSYTFTKAITATGWQDIFNYNVRDNMIHAFAGFSFTDQTLRVSQIRVEIGDRRYPIWDIQEAQLYNKFSLVLKEDEAKELIAAPSERVLIRIYAESTGSQRVVPVGLQLFRTANLVLTET